MGWSVRHSRIVGVRSCECVRIVRIVAGSPIFTSSSSRAAARASAVTPRHRVSPKNGAPGRRSRLARRRRRFGTRLVNENRSRIIWVRGHQPRRAHFEFKCGARRPRSNQSIAVERPASRSDNVSAIREVGRGPACRESAPRETGAVPSCVYPAVVAPFE